MKLQHVHDLWDTEYDAGESVFCAEAHGVIAFAPPIELHRADVVVDPSGQPTAVHLGGGVHVGIWLDAGLWPTPESFLEEARRRDSFHIVLRRCGGTKWAQMRDVDYLKVGSRILFAHARAGSYGDTPAFIAWSSISRVTVAGPYADHLGRMLASAQQRLHAPDQRLSVVERMG